MVVYGDGNSEPQVSLNIPLVGLKAAGDKIPSMFNEQMLRYGLDIEQILKHGGQLEPTTLLEVKEDTQHVIISLE